MKNKIYEACFTLLAFYLFACGLAAIVFIGMLLIPLAFIAAFVLAIREIIIWKRKIKPVKPVTHIARHKQTGILIEMMHSNTREKSAA